MEQQTCVYAKKQKKRKKSLEKRIFDFAEQIFNSKNYVRPIDVMIAIGWLQPTHVKDWQHGKVPFLEQVIQASLSKLNSALDYLKKWASSKKLKLSETAYMSHGTKSRRRLRFSKSGQPHLEQAYCTHYISPLLTEKKLERLQKQWEESPEPVVFQIITNAECSKCHKQLPRSSFLFKDGDDAKCMTCAALDHLVFLPSGDTKLTRLAKRYSNKSVIVAKFSIARKRYERQGLMVEEEALQTAQNEIAMVVCS